MVEKINLHKNNQHRKGYDFEQLIFAAPELEPFVAPNKYGNLSIDFFNPQAVKMLNKALLIHHYGVEYWNIPLGALCPPIPSRADYIHHLRDLVGGGDIKCLDVGVGANCIYPIIGCSEYNWEFVGSDIDSKSLKNAQTIVDRNQNLKDRVELRLQRDRSLIFRGIVTNDDYFDVVICNPPFHDSAESAKAGSLRKLRNLKGGRINKVSLNFAGQDNELWCDGGERQFIRNIITESSDFRRHIGLFSTLVSKEANIKPLCRELDKVGISDSYVLKMQQGNKSSHILAWRFK
jgi:23S rRNA (adenine1618-N6)-methyltransferase